MAILKKRKEPRLNISIALNKEQLEKLNEQFKKSIYKNRSAYILSKLGLIED